LRFGPGHEQARHPRAALVPSEDTLSSGRETSPFFRRAQLVKTPGRLLAAALTRRTPLNPQDRTLLLHSPGEDRVLSQLHQGAETHIQVRGNLAFCEYFLCDELDGLLELQSPHHHSASPLFAATCYAASGFDHRAEGGQGNSLFHGATIGNLNQVRHTARPVDARNEKHLVAAINQDMFANRQTRHGCRGYRTRALLST
jgi:hypothetical protein